MKQELTFVHPFTGEVLTVTLETPPMRYNTTGAFDEPDDDDDEIDDEIDDEAIEPESPVPTHEEFLPF